MGGGLWCIFSKALRAMFVYRTNRAYIEKNIIGENSCITGTKKGFQIHTEFPLASQSDGVNLQKSSKTSKRLVFAIFVPLFRYNMILKRFV